MAILGPTALIFVPNERRRYKVKKDRSDNLVTKDERPMIKIRVNGKKLVAFIDTGSQVSIIKRDVCNNWRGCKISKAKRDITAVNGNDINVEGQTDLYFELGESYKVHACLVVSGVRFPGDLLLGMDFLRRFDFLLSYGKGRGTSRLILDEVSFPIKFIEHPSIVASMSRSNKLFKTPSKSLFEAQLPNVNSADADYAVHVLYNQVCPPNTFKFIKGSVGRKVEPGSILQLAGKLESFLVPHHLAQVSEKRHILIPVINLTSKALRFKNGRRLTSAEIIPKDLIFEPDSVKLPGRGQQCGALNTRVPERVVTPAAPTQNESKREKTFNDVNLNHLKCSEKEIIKNALRNFPKLFSMDEGDIGFLPQIEHTIPTGDSLPVQTRQWRLPEEAKRVIREECNTMLQNDVIEPSSSPWLSPVVLVKKPDNSYRFCVDYRKVNELTIADSYPLPLIQEILDSFGTAKYFSTLDAKSAYWAIPVSEEDREKTAFSDGVRLYQFKRMPYGLKTAPSSFQRAINFILSPVLGRHSLAYLDDVVVYSRSFPEHVDNLVETLKLLDKAGFKLNAKKCIIAATSFKFLGFQVSPEGIRPDPDKCKAISEMPRPRTAREVRRFLGAAGYFRRHIKGFAELAAPLTDLTKKKAKFVWKEEHELAHEKLKAELTSEPVLVVPDFSREFEIHTDASAVAIGGCLMQRDKENNPHPVAYFSRKIKGPEVRYAITDKEALAVVESVRYFEPYVFQRHFKIITDHRALVHIFKKKTRCPRMSRWGYELSAHSYQILYKPGASHHVPDVLSRNVAAINVDVNIENVNNEKLREYQLEENRWKEIIEYLEGEKLPCHKPSRPIDEFEMKDGVLHRITELNDRSVQQVVIPNVLRKAALKLAHSSKMAGHPGVFRTYKRAKEMFYFPGLLNYVTEYVKCCGNCQRRKGNPQVNVELQAFPEIKEPLDRVGADLIDLHNSYSGNRYVLVLVDHLSRYTTLVPIPKKDPQTVAEALLDRFVAIFGPPRELVTDQGSEFKSKVFAEVCNTLEIMTAFTTAYHPQANGMVERTNQVVKNTLAILSEKEPLQWDKYIPYVQFALNTAIHKSIGTQPLFLFTGHDCHFAAGLVNQAVVRYGEDYPSEVLTKMRTAWRTAAQASGRAQEKYAHYYDRQVKPLKLKEGNLVMVYKDEVTPQQSRSLGPRWKGPYRILEKMGPVNVKVKGLFEDQSERIVHCNKLKPFWSEEEIVMPNVNVVDERTVNDEVYEEDRLHQLVEENVGMNTRSRMYRRNL